MNSILKEKRLEKNMTLEQVGKLVGVGKSTVRKWENGTIENMGRDKIVALSKALDISPLDILGIDKETSSIETIYNQLDQKRQQKVYSFAEQQLKEQNKIIDYPTKYSVNIYGKMTAGYGSINFDKEHPIKTVTLDYAPPSYDIAFEVSGDSMHPTFQDGEVIFVKETKNIHNGMLAAVEINDEAFIKKLYIEENRIRLVSLNCEKDKNGNRLS